jgi:hypothetical protein
MYYLPDFNLSKMKNANIIANISIVMFLCAILISFSFRYYLIDINSQNILDFNNRAKYLINQETPEKIKTVFIINSETKEEHPYLYHPYSLYNVYSKSISYGSCLKLIYGFQLNIDFTQFYNIEIRDWAVNNGQYHDVSNEQIVKMAEIYALEQSELGKYDYVLIIYPDRTLRTVF